MALTILQRIAAGEPEAVDECLEQYGGLIWSLARRFSSVHADAEDAVQETLLAIWRSASRFRPEVASEAAFITTIAKRRLIDRHRRKIRAVAAESIEVEVASAEDSSYAVEVQEEVERVQDAMSHLREDEQRVLQLSLVAGLTHSEIADLTQLPLGTVKTHARRGLHRLRGMLGATYSSPTPDSAQP